MATSEARSGRCGGIWPLCVTTTDASRPSNASTRPWAEFRVRRRSRGLLSPFSGGMAPIWHQRPAPCWVYAALSSAPGWPIRRATRLRRGFWSGAPSRKRAAATSLRRHAVGTCRQWRFAPGRVPRHRWLRIPVLRRALGSTTRCRQEPERVNVSHPRRSCNHSRSTHLAGVRVPARRVSFPAAAGGSLQVCRVFQMTGTQRSAT